MATTGFENLMGSESPDPRFTIGLSTKSLNGIFVVQGLRNNCDATARLIAYRYFEKKSRATINDKSLRTSTSLNIDANALNRKVDAGSYEIPNLYGGDGTWLSIAVENRSTGVHKKGSDYQKGLDYIDTCLKNGIPPIIGVGIPKFSSGNPDGSSDHFVVCVGKGRNGEYYYLDPGTGLGADLNQNVIKPISGSGLKKDELVSWTKTVGNVSGSIFLTFVAIYPIHRGSIDTLSSPKSSGFFSDFLSTFTETGEEVADTAAGGVVEQNRSRGEIPGQEQSDSTTSTQKSGVSVKFIRQISQPRLKPKEIRLTMDDKNAQREIAKNLGNFPIVYYNGVQIDYKDVEFLQLYTAGNLPTVKLVFRDTLSIMKDRGFPLDDSILTIFINSRTEQLKAIHLDFKIIKFSAQGRTYTMTASLDANLLYIKKFKSYSNKSSFDTLKEIADEIGLGFNSNIDDTNDSMIWINPGQKTTDFIEEVTTNSYKSDETYLTSYIDFFYNLNYVDVGKELARDVSEELGVDDAGLNEIYKKNPDLVSKLVLTNEIAFRSSSVYFKDYRVVNRSSTISLTDGYSTKIKYYNQLKKDFLVFDVEALTQDAENKIQLKGKAQDEEFYNENKDIVYLGKLDDDNMYSNYHYASIQNYRNLLDLEKIGLEVVMKSPNFNFYRYQKVLVFISNATSTPSNSLYNNRLSGEWLITDIIFRQDGSTFEQVIKLIKKELELTEEEANVTPKPRKRKKRDSSRGRFSNPSESGTPDSTSTSSATEVLSEDTYLPPDTAETDGMEPNVPPPPQNPTKSSPSGFPIKPTSFLKRERQPTQIVLHYTAGWQILDKGAGTIDFLMNGRKDYPNGLSYHYIISVDGHVENLVDPKYIASHGGGSNNNSIGISLASLGTTFDYLGIEGANKQLDNYRKSTNSYKKTMYGKAEDYVKLVNVDFQPIKYRNFQSCQEVSAAQIKALEKLLKSLKSRFPSLPSWDGLNSQNFEILFPKGQTYKSNVPGIYTHCSVWTQKVDIAPTPRLVQFLKNLRL